jgi:HlyD family secretion protein
MATPATVLSLAVRPFQAAHLAFEVGGILGELDVQLSQTVDAFPFTTFFGALGALPTVLTHPESLKYNVDTIENETGGYLVAALRAEPSKIALTKALLARENAYWSRYSDIAATANLMTDFYGAASKLSTKLHRLNTLSGLADQQATDLYNAYKNVNPSRLGVVFATQSLLTSDTDSQGQDTGQTEEESLGWTGNNERANSVNLPAGGAPQQWWVQGPEVDQAFQEGTSGEKSTAHAKETQRITNVDYGFRMPYIESQAQNHRAQISLMDERLAAFIQQQAIPNAQLMMQNELASIDLDVYQTQLGFLRTRLLSPITGIVTGIFKQPGEWVKAGEPIVRVESSDTVLLAGVLRCPAQIQLGAAVQVSSTLFEAAGAKTTVSGSVVAVRGQAEDDLWEVVVQCGNLDAAGQAILPLGYQFDYDDTTVSIA